MRRLLGLSRGIDAVLARIADWTGWFMLVLMTVIIVDVITRKAGFQFPYFTSTRLQELEWHLHTIIFAGWMGWAVVSNWVGTRLLPEPGTETNLMEMVRTIGFAATPGLLAPLALLFPEARLSVFSIALLWMLAATVTAIRAALDYVSTVRAVVVCAIGWVVQASAAALALYLLVATSPPLF